MPLTVAAIEQARQQLHEDLDSLVDYLVSSPSIVRTHDPVVVIAFQPPEAWASCTTCGATHPAR